MLDFDIITGTGTAVLILALMGFLVKDASITVYDGEF